MFQSELLLLLDADGCVRNLKFLVPSVDIIEILRIRQLLHLL